MTEKVETYITLSITKYWL